MNANEQLEQWDRKHVWHSFSQMLAYEPFVIEKAQGNWLFDIEGNRYFDGVSSMWCVVHGHNHPRLNQAIREQLERVAQVTTLGASNPTTIRLAKRLVDISPAGLNHVFFGSDGASAVEVALKMAFQYWRQIEKPQPQRLKFLALGNAYHGDTIGGVSVGGVEHFHSMFAPLLFEVERLPFPDCYRLPVGVAKENALNYYVSSYRRVFESNRNSVVGVIVEPLVQGAAGMVTHPHGLLRALRQLTREFNTLLIADEVAVGVGRTGTMFACEQENVNPDLLCIGKGLSGGYLPISATLTTTEIWNAFLGGPEKTLYHGHTYSGNPLCAAVALANLDIFDQEGTLVNVNRISERMADWQNRLFNHPHVGDVRNRGMLAAIELVDDKARQQSFRSELRMGKRVCQFAQEKEVWIRPLDDNIMIVPPLSSSRDEIDHLYRAIQFGIEKATGVKYLSS